MDYLIIQFVVSIRTIITSNPPLFSTVNVDGGDAETSSTATEQLYHQDLPMILLFDCYLTEFQRDYQIKS